MKNKIAFLILAHNDPDMLRRLIYSLDFVGFDIYVHVDSRTDIRVYDFNSYRLESAGLFILNKREKVYWGDYSVFKATYNMYYEANRKNIYFRYVTLSGNDYPLKSNEYIFSYLSNMDVEYIMGTPLERYEKVFNYNFMHGLPLFRKISKMLTSFAGVHRNKRPLIIDNQKFEYYYSPQWHALSGDCVSHIIDLVERNRKKIRKTFYYSYAPDELVIPTIVFNSEFSKSTLRSSFPHGTHYNEMTAIHVVNYEPIVQVLDENDAESLLTSGKLFARKFNSVKSKKLIEIIDKSRMNITVSKNCIEQADESVKQLK